MYYIYIYLYFLLLFFIFIYEERRRGEEHVNLRHKVVPKDLPFLTRIAPLLQSIYRLRELKLSAPNYVQLLGITLPIFLEIRIFIFS